jgi:hypothetical protein
MSNLYNIFKMFGGWEKKEKFKKCSDEELNKKIPRTSDKVHHFTKSKCKIKSAIDNELLLLHLFSQDEEKFSPTMKTILIDFYEARKPEDFIPAFCDTSTRCMNVKNAGAEGSKYSEAVSINYFAEKFAAKNFLLEMEVKYFFRDYKLVDYICNIYTRFRVGVSVTRAMNWRNPSHFSLEDAYLLLKRKLSGLIIARNCVSEENSFKASFLHIFCQTIDIANKINAVHEKVVSEDDTNTFREVIILATVCSEPSIYSNKFIGRK